MKLAFSTVALAIAGVCNPAISAELQGQVTDIKGAAIAGALVSIDGGKKTTTNAHGHYQLKIADNRHIHVHVSNKDYKHADKDLQITTGAHTHNFTLNSSEMENIVVTASPLARSAMESTTPISVLSEDQLKLSVEPTLGATLEKIPGVQSSQFGAGSSRPIIRGMSGNRVQVLQNGLSVGDVSTISADHAVTTEAASAEQIEILRGPGTLMYGNGAIGGVVNVVDKRHHEQSVTELTGEAGARYDSASDANTINGDLNGGNGELNWHLDGTRRRSDNVDIPGEAIAGHPETEGTLGNSQLSLDDFAAGVGYITDLGFVSIAAARTESNYGIPSVGDDEHDHDEHDEDEHEEPDHDEEEEAHNINIDLKKTAWQLHSGLLDPFEGVSKLKFDAAYTDYLHAEQENGEVGTQFSNIQTEAKLSAYNSPWHEWQGVMGLHLVKRDFSVEGEESLTPNSTTDTLAGFIIQERKVDDFRFELGARLEHYVLGSEPIELAEQTITPNTIGELNLSLSAGVVWDFAPSYNLGVSLARAERSPNAEELFNYGHHHATQSFELGSLFTIENGQVIQNSNNHQTEVANNLDVTLRKTQGDWTGTFSAAYNRVNNFYYQANSGLVVSDIIPDDHDGDLPVYLSTNGDVELYAIEAQVQIPLDDMWSLDVFSDYTRGKLVDGGNLPLMSPKRLGTTLNLDIQQWHTEVGVIGYAKQSDTAINETATAGYALMNAAVTYRLFTDSGDVMLYLKGNNLLNAYARQHTSLLKDYSPLMGRNIMVGVNYHF